MWIIYYNPFFLYVSLAFNLELIVELVSSIHGTILERPNNSADCHDEYFITLVLFLVRNPILGHFGTILILRCYFLHFTLLEYYFGYIVNCPNDCNDESFISLAISNPGHTSLNM